MRTFERQLLAGFGILIAVVAVTSALSLWSVRQSNHAHDDAEAAGRFQVQVANTSFALRDAAAAHRGYLLSGEPLFRERYEAAAQGLRERVAALHSGAQGDGAWRARVEGIAGDLEVHLATLDQAIAMERDGNELAAEALVLQGAGLQVADRLRADLAALHNDAGRERDRLIASADSTSQRAFLLTVTLGAVGLALGISALLLYRRDQARVRLAEAARRASAAEVEQLNRELAQRNTALEAANAELESFSYSVSHDLRAPLRTIDGFSAVLLEDYAGALDADGRATLDRIRAASNRMGLLIDDLLNLSRVTRAELRRMPVDVSALAHSIVGDLRRQDPARAVTVDIAPGLVAEGDPHLLRVLLENLLGNAWKFTRGQASARITFACHHAHGAPAYFVRDNGAGFDMTYVHKLFAPFQRLHRIEEFEGTGIGLATVARIARRHGGRAWAEGALGEGATFYFTLGGDGA